VVIFWVSNNILTGKVNIQWTCLQCSSGKIEFEVKLSSTPFGFTPHENTDIGSLFCSCIRYFCLLQDDLYVTFSISAAQFMQGFPKFGHEKFVSIRDDF
jgi:hypothetical protein